MKQKLIFASNNKGKIAEVKKILGDNFEVLSMSEIGFFDEIEETGDTFEENAQIKARAIFDRFKIPVFSDDSGLCVDILNGEPGAYSALYHCQGDDRGNNIKLLDNLAKIEEGAKIRDKSAKIDKSAKFVAVVAYIDKDGFCKFFRGEADGYIIDIKREKSLDSVLSGNGFGYDPLFFCHELGKTFGAASLEQKNSVSHRARALEKLSDYLKSNK
ncbi:MAG: RdgB/HAM1 family non-canonical purine NTP pyrophosphatase [Firmicutes bacterium]|nr:RdgB/HAM1 family non-canonical purine NTP pyrophosphatase [Bacillota bacterium]